MANRYHIAAALTLLLASPAVLAATPATDAASSASQQSGPNSIRPDQLRAHKMIGAAVYDRNNAKIGSVQDIVLNKDGTVAAIVVDVGSFLGVGGRNIAVRFSDIRTRNDRLTLDRTKQQLKGMTEYHLTNRNTGAGTTQAPATGGKPGAGSGR